MPVNGVGDIATMEMSGILLNTFETYEINLQKLSEMSLLDFWSLKNVGSRRLLELLALLEVRQPVAAAETVTCIPSQGTLEVIDQITERLGDADIASNDIRFGVWIAALHPSQLSLRKVLAELRTGARGIAKDPWPMLNGSLHAIDRKLVSILAGSLEDDLCDVLLTLCRGSERKVGIVALRLGWKDGVQKTLQEVGDMVNLTRERVRQMEDRAQRALHRRSVFSPKLTAALQLARGMAPCKESDLSKALQDQGLLRAPWRLSTLVAAASYLGLPHGLSVVDAGAGEILAVEIGSVETANRLARIGREIAQRQGAANVKDVAFRASEELQRWVSYKEAAAVIGSLPDMDWLDEVNGWFWCGEPAKSRVLGTIRKMLSVSPRISMDEIYEGLVRNCRMDEEGFAPKPIIQKVCARVPWIQVHQRAFLQRRMHFSWREELVGVERTLVEVLVRSGNALDHYDFKRRCLALGVPEGSFTVYEGNSPVIRRVSRGIYGLRGAVISPRLLVELHDKMQEREQKAARARLASLPPGTLHGHSNLCFFNITASVFKNHCMTLARGVAAEPGMRFQVLLDSQPLGSVTLTDDRRLRGLLPLLRRAGVVPGQIYRAMFDLSAQVIQMDRLVAQEDAVERVHDCDAKPLSSSGGWR